MLLILSLWTSYYVQVKRIRAVHETVLSIFAGMFVGMIVWLSPGHIIRDMLVSQRLLLIVMLRNRGIPRVFITVAKVVHSRILHCSADSSFCLFGILGGNHIVLSKSC